MKDRHRLDQFYSSTDFEYSSFQQITDEIQMVDKLQIVTLAMDFPGGTSKKERQKSEEHWRELLPTLDKVKALSVRHRVNQEFFEAICEMKNLETLNFWTSTVEDISSIPKLQKLRSLGIDSFSRLIDISPILKLSSLTHLSIENCFKVDNYEVVGGLQNLIGLKLAGNTFAPKNLRLLSLKPFESLKQLKHLDLSSTSVIDNSYDSVLMLQDLERFDINVTIPKPIREKIKQNHKTLKAGFFMDWDFDNKKLYEGKEW